LKRTDTIWLPEKITRFKGPVLIPEIILGVLCYEVLNFGTIMR
jgi:hypothetical protein